MEYEELLDLLDMESPEDFEYFDHLADLMELEEEVDYDGFFQILSKVTKDTMQELLRNYFTDIMEHMPDSTVEIHTLMEEIRQCLTGLSREMESEEGRRSFIDELYRFRNWYALEGEVVVKDVSTGKRSRVSVSEALAMSRLEALGGETYDYDFEDCLNYEPEEYSMTINEAMSAAYGDEIPAESHHHHHHDDGCDCGHDHDHDRQQELIDGLVDLDNPMMDDDTSYLE